MYAKLIVWRLGAEYRDGPGYETADGAYSAWHNVVSKPEYGAAGELELIFHPISRGDDLPMVGEMTALEDGKKAETLKSRLARPDGELEGPSGEPDAHLTGRQAVRALEHLHGDPFSVHLEHEAVPVPAGGLNRGELVPTDAFGVAVHARHCTLVETADRLPDRDFAQGKIAGERRDVLPRNFAFAGP